MNTSANSPASFFASTHTITRYKQATSLAMVSSIMAVPTWGNAITSYSLSPPMVTPMKAFRSKCLLALCLLALPTEGQELTPYQERLEKYKKRWEKFIPRYTKLQFAGSMGLISAGLGWDYYRKHWETDVLLGFIPAYADDNAKFTFTAKQNYYPWRIPLGRHFTFEPLACGAYVNILLDREFWGKQPDKYPDGYYWFSTRFRFHAFVGERITLKLNESKSWHKSISFFYELSTCDLYLINKIGNRSLKPKDYLSLSFGLKLQIF